MAKLTTKQRKNIPDKEFALPKERKYPVNDKAHAANAKARGQQQYDKGNISKSTLEKIDKAANKKLHGSKKEPSKKEKSSSRNDEVVKRAVDRYKGKK
jgi:hypothetical protein